jgi:hypothetical protein
LILFTPKRLVQSDGCLTQPYSAASFLSADQANRFIKDMMQKRQQHNSLLAPILHAS